ncbi:hypothetical protein EON63_04025 [archaeon]|nr:MAG: hypothetical protein EON63_04025 [archaeon]
MYHTPNAINPSYTIPFEPPLLLVLHLGQSKVRQLKGAVVVLGDWRMGGKGTGVISNIDLFFNNYTSIPLFAQNSMHHTPYTPCNIHYTSYTIHHVPQFTPYNTIPHT